MINVPHSILLIAICALVTFALRAFPFVIFGGKREMPEQFKAVANKLPPAIIAVLVIYCLKNDLFVLTTSAIASAVAIIAVVIVHIKKRNTLLSIALGTIIYMALIRVLPF